MTTRNVAGTLIAVTLALGIRPAAAELGKVEWNAPQPITGDADVCTDGTPLYAYCGAPTGSDALRVNGVAFTPDVRLYRALGDDILYDRFTFGESDARLTVVRSGNDAIVEIPAVGGWNGGYLIFEGSQ